MQQFNMKQKEECKETELGLLPESWEFKNFEKCINKEKIKVGKIKKREFKNFGKYPIIDQGQSLIAGYWDKEDNTYQGDLPVIIFGDHTRILKFVEFPFVCGADGTKIIVPNLTVVNPKFFYYSLKSIEIPSRGYNRHYSLLNENKIACPPIPEQKKISFILSTIQEAKEKTENVINSLKELKKSMLKHLFAYGPVSLEEAENVKLKETEIGEVPEGWRIKKIYEIGHVKSSSLTLSRLPGLDTKDSKDVLVHGIKVSDMNLPGNSEKIHKANIEIRLKENIAKKKTIPPFSIVFPKRGAAIATNKKRLTTTYTALDPNLIAVIPNTIYPDYLFYWFLTFDIKSIQTPGPTPQLNKKDVEPILLPYPSIDAQQKITSILSTIDAKIESEKNKKKALEELFKSMLHNLMTAKIRVNNLEI